LLIQQPFLFIIIGYEAWSMGRIGEKLTPTSPLLSHLIYNHSYESAFISLVVENSRLVNGFVPAGISDVSNHRRLDVSGENFAAIPFDYPIYGRK
jgi:hypothetical protein